MFSFLPKIWKSYQKSFQNPFQNLQIKLKNNSFNPLQARKFKHPTVPHMHSSPYLGKSSHKKSNNNDIHIRNSTKERTSSKIRINEERMFCLSKSFFCKFIISRRLFCASTEILKHLRNIRHKQTLVLQFLWKISFKI